MSEDQTMAKIYKIPGVRCTVALVLVCILTLWSPSASAATSEESATAIASLNAGTAAIQSGHALEAIDYLNAAIESNALSPEGAALAYHHRGIAHQKLGLAGHAVADYTNAIWQGGLPEAVLPRSYYNRAVAYAQMGQQDRAERDYDKAIELAPDYAAAYHNRANLRRHLGKLSAAIDDYTRALALGMGRQEHLTYFGRALAYNALGNKSRSLDDAARALELKPDFATARKALAEWGNGATPQVAGIASGDPIVTASITAPEPSRAPAPTLIVSRPTQTALADVELSRSSQTARAVPSNLDAVRVPAARQNAHRPITLSAPDVAAIEPQSGSVTVTPLAQALPPARASGSGWQTTVTRFQLPPAPSLASSNRVAAVPNNSGLVTASINRNANLPVITTSNLTASTRANVRTAPARAHPIRVAENGEATRTDGAAPTVRPALRVQVGSFRSAAEATTAWDRIANANRTLIGQKQPYIVEANVGTRGIFYRLQIGPLGSKAEVKALCDALKVRGQDCIPAL